MQTSLLISLLNLILLHPVHVSVSNIEYMPNNKSVEVLIKLYKDDLAMLLNAKYDLTINKDMQEDFNKYSKQISYYIQENFKLFADKKQIKKATFKGLETDKESIWLYYTFEKVKPFSKLLINNSLLLELFNDQTNLVITNIKGIQKGYSLDIEKKHVEIEIP